MKRSLTIIGSLFVLGLLGFLGYEFGYPYYQKKTWEPPRSVGPIEVGSLRKDVLFSRNYYFRCDDEDKEPSKCDDVWFSTHPLLPTDEFFRYPSRYDFLRFQNDKIVYFQLGDRERFPRGLSYLGINQTLFRFGDPDILWVSEDFSVRQYVYVDEQVSFRFERDQVELYQVGEIQLEDTHKRGGYPFSFSEDREFVFPMNISEYTVRGRNLCPSIDCPFNDDGSVKDEFVGMSLVDFVERI